MIYLNSNKHWMMAWILEVYLRLSSLSLCDTPEALEHIYVFTLPLGPGEHKSFTYGDLQGQANLDSLWQMLSLFVSTQSAGFLTLPALGSMDILQALKESYSMISMEPVQYLSYYDYLTDIL